MKLFPARGFKPKPKPRPEFGLALLHANRPDLTLRALGSIERWWPVTTILDNSPTREFLLGTYKWVSGHVRVVGNTVPLSFTQSMNLVQQWAIDAGLRWFACMHNDAFVRAGDFERFEEVMDRAVLANYGYVLTNYDALVAFNRKAVEDVGPWDTNLIQYYSDNDYYLRMRHRGWAELHSTDLHVIHEPSQTIASDARRRWLMEKIQPHCMNYYREKWGGIPGRERYEKPWNGEGYAT